MSERTWMDQQDERKYDRFYQVLQEVMHQTYIKLDGSEADDFRIVQLNNRAEASYINVFGARDPEETARDMFKMVDQGMKLYFFAPGEAAPHEISAEEFSFQHRVLDPAPVRPEEPVKPSRLHRFVNAITFGLAYKKEMDVYKGDMILYQTELEVYNEKMGAIAPISERLADRKQSLQNSETLNEELAFKVKESEKRFLEKRVSERKAEISHLELSAEVKEAAGEEVNKVLSTSPRASEMKAESSFQKK